MSGSISSSILSLFGASTSSASSGILSALYGSPTGTAGNPNALSALQTAEQDQTQDIATTAKEPQVQREIVAFQNAVAGAKTPAQLLANPTALTVLLTANGLGDQTSYTALAKQALLSDTTDPESLANKLTDTRWLSTAQTYDFANKGLTVLQNPKVIAAITNGYAEVMWRQSLDTTTPGLSNALTFRAEASGITSVDQILGDSVMRTVVTTALGIPPQIAFQPLEAQEKAISNRLDLTKFQDPKFVEQFTQRYLVAAQQTASSTSSSNGLVV